MDPGTGACALRSAASASAASAAGHPNLPGRLGDPGDGNLSAAASASAASAAAAGAGTRLIGRMRVCNEVRPRSDPGPDFWGKAGNMQPFGLMASG